MNTPDPTLTPADLAAIRAKEALAKWQAMPDFSIAALQDCIQDALLAHADALTARAETAERERDELVRAIGVHITVRSEYLARAEAAEAKLAALESRAGPVGEIADLLNRLTAIAEHDWRFSFLAHTSDTAREAHDTLAAITAERIAAGAVIAPFAKAAAAAIKRCVRGDGSSWFSDESSWTIHIDSHMNAEITGRQLRDLAALQEPMPKENR